MNKQQNLVRRLTRAGGRPVIIFWGCGPLDYPATAAGRNEVARRFLQAPAPNGVTLFAKGGDTLVDAWYPEEEEGE